MTGCSANKGISSATLLSDTGHGNAFLLPVKFYKQNEPNKCGIVALRSIFDYYDIDHTDIESIFNEELNATRLITIINYADKYLDTRTERIGYDGMAEIIAQGDPIIILQKDPDHYSVVKGFVIDERKIIINDGYSENVVLPLQPKESAQNENIAVIFKKRDKNISSSYKR